MQEPNWVPHEPYVPDQPPQVVLDGLHETLRRRRSVRMFSDRPIARGVIEQLIRCATTAPSGANKQPWRFVCVADTALKRRIREGAEQEERAFYGQRATDTWLADLAPLGTDENKSFLQVAPWLIVVFRMTRGDDGSQVYYPSESVGLAVGLLLAAAQCAGLATLTHTPSPMKFLNEILGRPDHERPYLLIPVGYPSEDCVVPAAAIERKPLDEVMIVHEGDDG